jgi:hypothetical protein
MRGQIRVCLADAAIERDAEYLQTLGKPMRTAIRTALARYFAVLGVLRQVKAPGVDNASAVKTLMNLLDWDKRQALMRSKSVATLWQADGLPSKDSLPSHDDPVVLRIRASMYRKRRATTA